MNPVTRLDRHRLMGRRHRAGMTENEFLSPWALDALLALVADTSARREQAREEKAA